MPAAAVGSCPQCQHNPLQFIDGIRSAAYFENNPIRPAIHFLKYRNHKAIAAILGQIMVDVCQKYGLEAHMIVPVPLHTARLRERGYNQCELLAREVGTLLNLPVDTNSLQRIRHTKSQMKLGATERHQNVIDAFACRDQALLGQTVLLIDDVCTTGSTLDACACALKQAGVISVWGITLAKAC
jgi:ComF family protein